MPIKFDDSGLKRFQKKMQELKDMKTIPFSDFLTDDFIRANTDFQTAQEMLDASGIESGQDEVTEALDQFVATHSNGRFSGWHEMTHTAFGEYVKRKLAS